MSQETSKYLSDAIFCMSEIRQNAPTRRHLSRAWTKSEYELDLIPDLVRALQKWIGTYMNQRRVINEISDAGKKAWFAEM